MGVAKVKRSKSRTHKKRSAWSKMDAISTMVCPNCHEAKLPHRVCPSCGFYKGRQVGAEEKAKATNEN